jgi:glycosyltransferase involved in cell wall biosynthesis
VPAGARSETDIVVLTEMDEWSASTRYRALQHVPRLERRFASVGVSLAGDTIGRSAGRVGQVRYFGAHAAHYARRGLGLERVLAGADALLVQRGLYVIGPGAIARRVERFTGRVVFDLDDAVFRLRPSLAHKGAAARWLYGPQQALRLLHRADAIIVSTPTLAEMLPAGVPVPTILPTVPDPARFPLTTHDPQRPVVIGWAGTIGGLGYLDSLGEVFGRLARERVATLEVVSSAPWRGPSSFHRWRLEEEVSVFGRFCIGIMPLPDTEYTRAKAGFKLLQYMAAGIPVVTSPIGVNRELVERSQAGFLAAGPHEWEEAIRTLALDADLRREMGARGRRFVEGYADLEGQADTIADRLSP